MNPYEHNLALGTALRTAFAAQDRDLLGSLVHEDFVWKLPGENAVSGDMVGVDGVFSRFAKLAAYGVTVSIEQVTVNRHGVAFILHNTGTHAGRVLDEYLVTVITVIDGKAAELETYLSDIPMMNAYFV
jgi:ketosteroid isomerase-like protein